MRPLERAIRGAAAGAAATSAWSAVEPLAAKALGHDFTDVRLLGRFAVERWWAPVGILIHAANGAVFGAAFALAGARGPKAGLAWAGAEAVLGGSPRPWGSASGARTTSVVLPRP